MHPASPLHGSWHPCWPAKGSRRRSSDVSCGRMHDAPWSKACTRAGTHSGTRNSRRQAMRVLCCTALPIAPARACHWHSRAHRCTAPPHLQDNKRRVETYTSQPASPPHEQQAHYAPAQLWDCMLVSEVACAAHLPPAMHLIPQRRWTRCLGGPGCGSRCRACRAQC